MRSPSTSAYLLPIKRLMDEIVLTGFKTDCLLANCPTSFSLFLVKATTDGVNLDPSALMITVGSEPSITAITELVVPRSMPTTLDMRAPP